jgi:hypothetical protein
MVKPGEAFLWLGPRRSAVLEFGLTSGRADFLGVADRLCRECAADVTERYPETGWAEDAKEYWWLTIAGRPLLLMRGPPPWGPALLGWWDDVVLLGQIAAAFGISRRVGWRWPLYRVWCWLGWGKKPVNRAGGR